MTDPWIIPSSRFMTKEAKAKKDAQNAVAAAKALADQQYVAPKPKSGGGLFSSALGKLGDMAGAVVDAPVIGDVLHGANLGLQGAEKYVGAPIMGTLTGAAGMPRTPITDEQGNVTGYKREGGQGLLDWAGNVGESIQHPLRAGKAYNEYTASLPAIGQLGAQAVAQPLNWVGPGIASKLIPGTGIIAKVARNMLDQGGGRTVLGAYAGSYGGEKLAEKAGASPGQQKAAGILGGLAGGIGGGMASGKRLEQLSAKTGKIADKLGIIPEGAVPFGAQTQVSGAGETFSHATPYVIPKGEIMISPRGDIGAGLYTEQGALKESGYLEGDPMVSYGKGENLSPSEAEAKVAEGRRLAAEEGSKILHLKAKKDLLFLVDHERVTPDELARVRNTIQKYAPSKLDMFNSSVSSFETGGSLRDTLANILGTHVDVAEILNKAGFDGMTNGNQHTVFKPNEVFAHVETIQVPPTKYQDLINQYTVPELRGMDTPEAKAALKWKEANPKYDPNSGIKPGMGELDPSKLLSPEDQRWAEISSLNPEQMKKYYQLKSEQQYTPHSYLMKQVTGEVPTQAPGWDPSKNPPADWGTPGQPGQPSQTQPSIVSAPTPASSGPIKTTDYNWNSTVESLNPEQAAEFQIGVKAAMDDPANFNAKLEKALNDVLAKGQQPNQTQSNLDPYAQQPYSDKAPAAFKKQYMEDFGTLDGVEEEWKASQESNLVHPEPKYHGPDLHALAWDAEFKALTPQQQDDFLKWMHSPQAPQDKNLLQSMHQFQIEKGLDSVTAPYQTLESPKAKSEFEILNHNGLGEKYWILTDAHPSWTHKQVMNAMNPEDITSVGIWGYNAKSTIAADTHAGIGNAIQLKPITTIEQWSTEYGKLNQIQMQKYAEYQLDHPTTGTPEKQAIVSMNGYLKTQGSDAVLNKGKENPVTPEDIIGTPQQGTEDWINKITSENPTYQTHVSAAPGETPNKLPSGWGSPTLNSEAMLAEVDSIMAKYPNLDPAEVAKEVKLKAMEDLGGGAPAESLVTQLIPTLKLTGLEKTGNAFTKIKKFLINHGVEDNAVATPMAREYLRINNVLKTQATNFAKIAQRAEESIPLNQTKDDFIRTGLNAEQRDLLNALDHGIDGIQETLNKFGTKFKDLPTFIAEKRATTQGADKRYSDLLNEYGNAVANKVATTYLSGEVNRIGAAIAAAPGSLAGRQTRRLNLAGASKIELPTEIADIFGKAIAKVYPRQSSDFIQLFNAVNNTLRGLWATGDASFWGIQMIPTWADNPKLAGQIMQHSLATLKDPTAFAKYIIEHDKAAYGTPRPTSTRWIENGLAIVSDTGSGTDIGGLPGRVKKAPIIGGLLGKADRLFSESGNFNRVALADWLFDNYKEGGLPLIADLHVPKGADESAVLRAIANAANRATGYANKGIGGSTGSALFFAPRFMQAQFEMIVKAASDGSLEGKIARRQLVKLAMLGSSITIAANAARGKETEYNPTSSNFMRIRDVGGVDLSVFGPWDSLVRGVIRGLPQVDREGDVTLGDPTYLLRSKLSPVISTAVDLIKGENVLGQKVDVAIPTNLSKLKGDANLVKNAVLPFSVRGIGTEPAAGVAAGFFGIKGAPLTGSEKLDKTLSNAGITKSDPEYLIKRRDYLAAHPGDIPNATSPEFKKTQAVQSDIVARRSANDAATLNNEQTLVQFRSNRKTLLREQRDKLSVLIDSGKSSGNSQQSKWLKSYFDLFNQNIDPITKDIDPTTLDVKIAEWTTKNGQAAANFVDKYMGSGLTPVEKAYHEDLAKLDAAGYFNMPRYTHMSSGLTDNQIDDYMAQVQAVRITDPKLQAQPIASTVKLVLGSTLTPAQLRDISNSTKTAYQNPAVAKFRATHRKELLWFNPKANWASYNSVVNGVVPRKGSSNITPISGTKLKSMLG